MSANGPPAAGSPRVDGVVAVVGAGPRGAGVLSAFAEVGLPRDVAVVLLDGPPTSTAQCFSSADAATGDDPGPWSSTLPSHLIANTQAGQLTLVEGRGRYPGSLLDWCRAPRDTPWAAVAASATPDDFLPRHLVGRYVADVVDTALRALARRHPVWRVRARVRAVVPVGAGGRVRLDLDLVAADDPMTPTATEMTVDAVVLTTGNGPSAPTRWAADGQPAPLAGLTPGSPVVVRGLGLTAHDVIATLTVGCGGYFTRAPLTPAYYPSGSEPLLLLMSRSGRPRPPKHPLPAASLELPSGWGAAAATRLLDAAADARVAASALRSLVLEGLRHQRISPHLAGINTTPSGRGRCGPDAVHARILAEVRRLQRVAADPEAALGAGACQAAVVAVLEALAPTVLDALSGAGPSVAAHDDHSRAAYAADAMECLGSRLTSGPPPARVAQLAALADAGVVRFLGAEHDTRLSPQSGAGASPGTPAGGAGWWVRTDAYPEGLLIPDVIDARVPPPQPTWEAGSWWRRDEAGRPLVGADGAAIPGSDAPAAASRIFSLGPAVSAGSLPQLPRPGGSRLFFEQNRRLARGVAAVFDPGVDARACAG